MNYFDIGIIVIVGLATLIGFARGFFKTLGSLFSWLISLVIAILLAKVVANALLGIPFISKYFIYNADGGFSFYNWIYGLMPDSLQGITMDRVRDVIYINGQLAPDASGQLIDLVKSENSILGIFLSLFKDSYVATLIGPEMMAYNMNNLGQGLALLLANSLLVLFSGILLLIVMKILTSIIVKIFEKKIYAIGKVGLISRVFGAVLGAFKGICISAVLLVLLSFMINLPFMSNPREELLEKDSLFAGKFAETVFEGTDKLLKTKDIDKIMKKSEFEKSELSFPGNETAPNHSGSYEIVGKADSFVCTFRQAALPQVASSLWQGAFAAA